MGNSTNSSEPSATECIITKRILVVDDNRDNLELMAMLLRSWGYEVLTADDGPDGVAMAERHVPDVVILDLALPGMDGYEVARHLRDRLPGARLIAVTGFSSNTERERSRQAGFDDFFVKPVALDALRTRLETLTSQR